MSDLSLLASGVAGRTVVVATDEAISTTWSDGETIYHADDCDIRSVLVQAALIGVGALDPQAVAKTAGRRVLRGRYLTLEVLRAVDQLQAAIPRRLRRSVQLVYEGKSSASSKESFERARSREDIPEAPSWFGELRPAKLLRRSGAGESVQRVLAKHAKENQLDEADEEEDTDTSKILELFTTPFGGGPLADAFKKLFGAGRSAGQDGAGGDELTAAASRGVEGRAGARIHDRLVDPPLNDFLPQVGRAYPEWDCYAKRMKPEHCWVAEYDPPATVNTAGLEAVHDRALLRELARLGLAQERHRRQLDGDVLDLSALTSHVIDRAAGTDPDPRIYEVARRTGHDLGVVVLLDTTGSTADTDHGRRVFDDQREVTASLVAALEQLGDRVAAYGFQSYGNEKVRFLRVKGFDDRFDGASRRRLADLEPGGFTRLGAAVRHGAWLATKRSGTVNNLLIVVGDGLPYDDGYEQRYAREDSRRALSEAVELGVGCACVAVRPSTDEAVINQVWGHVPHIEIDAVEELSRHVLRVFRRSLREAVLLGRDGRQGRAASAEMMTAAMESSSSHATAAKHG